MSTWTHIAATIVVETFATEKNIKGYIKRKLKNSPKITGSEGNADIFVNELSGYNFYTSADCKRCKYEKTWKYDYDGSIICDADIGHVSPQLAMVNGAILEIISQNGKGSVKTIFK